MSYKRNAIHARMKTMKLYELEMKVKITKDPK